jgi:1-acyl-sn-glycerol-3-phosphate acyltransferase
MRQPPPPSASPPWRRLYPYWAWTVLALATPVFWIAAALAPSVRAAWWVLRLGARAVLRATATPLRVEGLDNLAACDRPLILVANHCSYLDVLVLMAVVPRPIAFVAKAELGRPWTTRLPLDRIGTLFVDRFDRRRALADYRRVVTAARDGRTLLFFPEGTFRPEPVLLPFQPGAFLAAVEAEREVVPIAVRGTRDILPSGTNRPRWAPVTVTIGPPITPPADLESRQAAAEVLSRAARTFIAAHCGDADGDVTQT